MDDQRLRAWMTVADVADYLRLSRSKVYEMAQRGEIPCSKVARRWRFSREEIDAWMRHLRPVPATEGAVDEHSTKRGGSNHA